MGDQESGPDEERRLRRAALTAASRQPPEPEDDSEQEDDSAPGQRLEQRALWTDLQIRRAMARGEFDDLPGAGKPIRGLSGTHDPDWWVKNLIEREQLTGVAPPALGLRKEDAELDARLDREATEEGVRRTVADFNQRVVEARRQLLGGPPVVTPTRDVDEEVVAWRARRVERRDRVRAQRVGSSAAGSVQERFGWRPGWWPRRHRRPRAG